MLQQETLEPLSKQVSVYVSQSHRFNTDTILLAHFSMPCKGDRCADLGTGCGAIPLLWLARSLPQQVFGVELQEDACQMARRSAERNGFSQQLTILNQDIRQLRECLKELPQLRELDLVSCNPPYKPDGSGLKSAEDGRRIARHEEECTLADVCSAASAMLRFGGRLCLCQRPERLCDVLEQMRANGIEPKRLRFVQQRPDKAPFLFLVQGAKGRKPGLVINPTLLVEKDGGFSPEMLEIYGDYKEGHI